MAEDVQRLLLQIDASTTLLRQEVAKARSDIDGFADRSEKKLSGLNSSFDGMGKTAGMAATKIAGMATAFLSVSQAAGFLIRANADMQRLSAQLEVATGSTQKASAAMSDLQKFAAETPFTLTQVVEGFIKLKNLGLDPSVEAMRSFGNTSAAMGKDVMQFIEAVADAATGEFERLKEFGIRASKEGNNVKFTFQGVTTTVQNSADAITNYLKSLGDESGVFAGSMAKQMETIDGKISNLEDAAARFATTLGALGFNELFMSQLSKATKGLEYLERVALGLSNIRRTEGVGAMMTTSFDEAAMSGTPEGMRQRLIRQANEATSARIDAERQQAGFFPMAGQAFKNTIAAERFAQKRLAEFEYRNSSSLALGGFGEMVPGFGGGSPRPRPTSVSSKSTTKKSGRASPVSDFIDPSMRAGWALGMQDSPELEIQNQALRSMAETLRELKNEDFTIDVIEPRQIQIARDFTSTLAQGLAASIVYGEKLGDILKNIGQNLLMTGLNAVFQSAIGSVFGPGFGGFRANGGPVSVGKAYVVGERGPEMFIPKSSGFISPNEAGMGGGQGGTTKVVVEPSPLFTVTVIEGATQAAKAEVASGFAKARRPRMSASMGV